MFYQTNRTQDAEKNAIFFSLVTLTFELGIQTRLSEGQNTFSL